MSLLTDVFSVLPPDEMDGALRTKGSPTWITFDDGDPSVVEVALPILREFDYRAALFVCPSLIDTSEPYWWQVVTAAADHRVTIRGEPVIHKHTSYLKQLPDKERRDRVAGIRSELEKATGRPLEVAQLTTSQLAAWVEAGNAVGNHTWSHPLLNRCEASVQREQIIRAHDWLKDRVAPDQLLFAYPNGNWTDVAEQELRSLGYKYAFLFDHRVVRLDNPLRVSRIRVNAHDDLDTFLARASGLHPAVHHILGRA